VSADIVVTGLGVVSPLGSSVQDFWTGLLQRESIPQDYPFTRSE
jgi:3-oxoacyl-(acyl-carrier-protein) synthase